MTENRVKNSRANSLLANILQLVGWIVQKSVLNYIANCLLQCCAEGREKILKFCPSGKSASWRALLCTITTNTFLKN